MHWKRAGFTVELTHVPPFRHGLTAHGLAFGEVHNGRSVPGGH